MKYQKFFFVLILISFGCHSNKEGSSGHGNKQMTREWDLKTYEWILSSLYVCNTELFFGGEDECFYCVDLESGKTKWKYKTAGKCYFPPALTTSKIFFTSFDLFLYALNHEGKMVWKYRLPNKVKSQPVFYSGLIIVSVTSVGVIAIDEETGKLIWEIPQDLTDLSTAQPVLSSGILLIGNLSNTFSAYESLRGKRKWDRVYPNTILSAPSANDTIVVYGGFNVINNSLSFVRALNIKTGKEFWEKKIDCNARYSPLIYNDRVYIGTEGSEIICLNIVNGSEFWRLKLDGDGIGSEFLALNNSLYFSGYARNCYEINTLTGRQVSKITFSYGVGNPLSRQGDIFIGTGKGELYKFKN